MPVRSARRRYLWTHIESEQKLNDNTLNRLIEAKIHFLYGVNGAVEMNYKLIEYLPDDHDAIIRCNHNRLNEMRATLASINMVDEKPCRIDVKIVSGTIKSLKNHFHPSHI
jgi:RNase P/RNase MRP subunit POP5